MNRKIRPNYNVLLGKGLLDSLISQGLWDGRISLNDLPADMWEQIASADDMASPKKMLNDWPRNVLWTLLFPWITTLTVKSSGRMPFSIIEREPSRWGL